MHNIYYGCETVQKDITQQCIDKCMKDSIIRVPPNDFTRSFLFTDPCVDILKSIYVKDETTNEILGVFDSVTTLFYDTKTNLLYSNLSTNLPENIKSNFPDVEPVLRHIHSQLKFEYGSLNDEYPEQLLTVQFITGNENILELGGNTGRNSVVMGKILNEHNNTNLVVLECNKNVAQQLAHNRNINNLFFHVEPCALSVQPIYQKEGEWVTEHSPKPGYTKVDNISFTELETKYNIQFDTLVMDCEGAFYYILQEMPNILQNIKLVIMENDYNTLEQKRFVDEKMRQNGLERVHWEAGGWGPCYPFFYEVWKRS
jgi:FkbM family methyltransferase